MSEVMSRLGVPEMIYCDEGSEFNNAPFKKLCNDVGIKLVFTIRHAPIVERFNRTLKEMLHKYLQSTNTKTIVNVLPKIVKNYNNSYHSMIGMTPNEVNEDTMHIAQINLIRKLHRVPYVEYKVGGKVRVQVKPKSFMKGYKPKYSKTVYEITDKGEGWYETTKDDRRYLKSNLQLVDEAEMNPEQPDLEGTREGHLRDIRNRPREEFESAAQIDEEPPRRRSVRERRPENFVVDEKFGKIRW